MFADGYKSEFLEKFIADADYYEDKYKFPLDEIEKVFKSKHLDYFSSLPIVEIGLLEFGLFPAPIEEGHKDNIKVYSDLDTVFKYVDIKDGFKSYLVTNSHKTGPRVYKMKNAQEMIDTCTRLENEMKDMRQERFNKELEQRVNIMKTRKGNINE